MRHRNQSADKAHNRKNCPDKNKIGCNFCFRRWICRALRDRQIQSPLATNFAAGKISSSAALASCGHLRPCKLPWMQVCFLGLRAFSTLCQSVDFVNILRPVRKGTGPHATAPPRWCRRRSFRRSTWRPPPTGARSRARPFARARRRSRSAACWYQARRRAPNGTRCPP